MAQAQPDNPAEAPAVDSGQVRDVAEFGRAIRRRREQLGHTQAEAAALCHVGTRFLSELERGKPTAEIGKALTVARRLGLEVSLSPRGVARAQDKRR